MLAFSTPVFAETEPNNSCSQANMLLDTMNGTDSGWVNGTVTDNNDEDWYKIVLLQPAEVRFDRNKRNNKKTRVQLYNSDCSTNAGWDVDNKTSHKTLTLASNTYYLRVSRSNKDNAEYKVRAHLTKLVDFQVTKSADSSIKSPGDTVTYTIVVRNNGPKNGKVRITDTLPTGLHFLSVSGCNKNENGIDCSKWLNSGVERTITLNATVANSVQGTLTNTVYINKDNSNNWTRKLFDTNVENNLASAQVTIVPPNTPPTANDVSAQTNTDTPVTIHLDASDPDVGDSIQSYPIVTGPSHGTLSGAEPDITYTPDAGYYGTDTFTYEAIDSHGAVSNTATVTITVNGLPVAQNDATSTNQGTAVSIDVLHNDSDPDGDSLTVTGTSNGPAHGSVTVNGDNTITYTPDFGYTGSDSFDYTISDGHGGTATATVTITVNALTCGSNHGLDGKYFNNTNFSPPVALQRIDPNLDFAWGTSSPGAGVQQDDFSVVWTGDLLVPEDANYIFSVAHDDSLRLYIDGNKIYDGPNWTGGENNFVDTNSLHLTPGCHTIRVELVEGPGDATARLAWRNDHNIPNQTIIPSDYLFTDQNTGPNALDDSYAVNAGSTLSVSAPGLLQNDSGNTLQVTSHTDPAHGTLSINADGGFSYTPDPGYAGSDGFDYTVTDINNATDTAHVSITVNAVDSNQVEAVDDSYSVETGHTISGNVMNNDTGSGIHIISHTDPSKGTLTLNADGSFTYTPDPNKAGDDSFTYTIQGDTGLPDSATVVITITGTVQTSGNFLPFYLINPIRTRNIVGNYKIAGNTMLCLTGKTDGYGGTCQGDNPDYELITSNMHVSKYLDIDDDNNTWNSTSSIIRFPSTFNRLGGVLWAGLFWQGRLSTDKNHPIHYAVPNSNGSGYHFVEIGENSNADIDDIDMAGIGAGHILLKVDNGAYQDADANTLHVYQSSNGKTYDAYADVTPIVQSAIQNDGNHTFTVANLLTMEGRENSPGAYGGWSLVVIYAEDYTQGKARNISIYNGFISIGTHDTPIEISGFKLPTNGPVNASLSVFSGEGEFRYGRNPYNHSSADWMKISDHDGDYDYLPGVPAGDHRPNRDNLFDAILTGIERPHIVKNGQNMFNDQSVNNVGIDVDTFDVSQLMTDYRSDNPNINRVFIKTYSNNDYVTPGMMAFSAQLYQPEVCYDYVVKRNEFLIPSEGREYNSTISNNDEISFTVAIRSMEGDMQLRNTSVAVTLAQDDGNLTANSTKAYYSVTNSNTLLSTPLADMSRLPERPVITIGKGRTKDRGGILSPQERYFTKFYYDYKTANNQPGQSRVAGHFNIEVNATMNFGSGDFWQILRIDRCAQNLTYNPVWYRFNAEKPFTGSVPSDPTQHYSLPTRIAGKDFNYSIASYIKNPQDNDRYTLPAPADGVTVNVEMINIDAFDDNGSYFKCSNPDPTIIVKPGTFVYFTNGQNRKNIMDANDLTNTYAIRSATFRMWLLIDENGTIVSDPTQFHDKTDNAYFEQVYNTYFKNQDTANLCLTACQPPYSYTSPRASKDPSAVGCYACLRDYFAQPYCARDNFAIRPKAIRLSVGDRGPDANLSTVNVAKNDTHPNNDRALSAGYPYAMDLTTVKDDDTLSVGYYTNVYKAADPLTAIPAKKDGSIALEEFTTPGSCAEDSNRSLGITFNNGLASIQLKNENAGQYRIELWDSNWTFVDRAYNNPHKTLFNSSCAGSNSALCNDCVLGSTSDTENGNGKVGCSFGSKIDSGSGNYTDLNLSFRPYKFSLNGLNLHTRPHDANPWIYMNDLNRSKTMAVTVEGNITALGADDTVLTNYTAGCEARDLDLHMGTNSIPDPVLDENNATVPLEQTLYQYISSAATENYSAVIDADQNLTLTKWNFRSGDQNGSAGVTLLLNLKKPYDTPVNVADINFTIAHIYGVNDLSYTNQISNYRPDGNKTIGVNKYFYFAKVAPLIGADGHNEFYENYQTRLRVDVYCDDNATNPICSTLPGLVQPKEEDDISGTGKWYRISAHTQSDGNVTQLSIDNFNNAVTNGATVNPFNNIPLDNNGSSPAITIHYPPIGVSPRPEEVKIWITPQEWLKYNPAIVNPADPHYGEPSFSIFFQNWGLKWKGEGKTGNVIQTEPSTIQNQRINW